MFELVETVQDTCMYDAYMYEHIGGYPMSVYNDHVYVPFKIINKNINIPRSIIIFKNWR